MKAQYDHTLLSSFYLWFDDRLTRVGEAVETGNSQIFEYYDAIDSPQGFNSFFSPQRQFSANGTGCPSGVFVNGTGISQSSTGMLIDHDQGRILLASGYGTGVEVSGNFVEKEINVYITNDFPEEIVTNQDFVLNGSSETYLQATGENGLRRFTIPAVFVTSNASSNEPFALGGMDETVSKVRAMVVATSNYELDGVMSLFRDSANKSFKLIDYEDFPYGAYWSVKNPPYYYPDLASQSSEWANIKDVNVYKLKDHVQQRLNKGILLGFLDFKISRPRIVDCD